MDHLDKVTFGKSNPTATGTTSSPTSTSTSSSFTKTVHSIDSLILVLILAIGAINLLVVGLLFIWHCIDARKDRKAHSADKEREEGHEKGHGGCLGNLFTKGRGGKSRGEHGGGNSGRYDGGEGEMYGGGRGSVYTESSR